MKFRCRLYSTLIFILFLNSAYAQKVQLDFNLLTGANGITLGKITSITQDKWGYMWFCDQDNQCITRYDGYRMKTYKHDPANNNSIGSSSFECIAADSSGNIWHDTNEGVDRLDPLTGIATHFIFKRSSSCKGGSINNILVDRMGSIWLGTTDGLYSLDQKTGNFTCYSHHDNDPTSLSCNTVRALYEDHEGTIWVGTGFEFDTVREGGLNKFNRATGSFTRYMHDDNDPHTLINDKVRAIFEDSRGVLWVGTQGDGLHIMNRTTGTFERLTYDPAHPEKLSRPPIQKGQFWDNITFIKEDISGQIWIGAYMKGLTRYDPVTKETTRYKLEKSRRQGFADSSTWNAFISKDGELWISTEERHLFKTDPYQRSFHSIGIPAHANEFIEDREGYLWVSTEDGGLFKFDQQKKLMINYMFYPGDSIGIGDPRVGPLFQGEDNNILLVGTFSGLRVLNKSSNKFSHFYNYDGLRDSDNKGFTRIFRDKEGIMWFGRWGLGLVRYDPKDNSTKQFRTKQVDSTSIVTDFLNSVIEDSSGTIWTGGNGGISSLNQQTGKFKSYLKGSFIRSLYVDSRSNLLAGTDNGLYYYDKTKDNFINFLESSSEINSLSVGGIIEDNDHNLWLVSPSSIIKLNPLTKETFIYGSKLGLQPNSLHNWTKTYKDKNGQLFVGHDQGFYIISPEELSGTTDFNIIVTDLFINTFPILPGEGSPIQRRIEEMNELHLNYNQNNISFNFTAIDYRNPESIRFFTMLEGYDNIWREVTGEKTSNYFNLPRGKYIYRVKAFNSDGTKTEKAITIRIHPPWWETWWAYTIYIVLFIVAVSAFIKWRIRALQREKIILEQKVTERTKELQDEKEIVESTLVELKSAQAQLIQSEKMASLGEMTAGIAHEIQNPLNFVNNFSEVNDELLKELKTEAEKGNLEEVKAIANDIAFNSEKINHHGKRADAIVKGMLQHSRTSSGKKELTDINALCDEYLRLSYHGLRAKDKSFNAKFETSFDNSIEKINVISQDMGRVILNLINNAFYAVNEKKKVAGDAYDPTIIISTKKINNKIEIKVKDNGLGIPSSVLPKIFQPFFTTKPTGQGTGLGLSLSYDIVKAHRGEIKVETKESEGTEFIIQLPAN